MKKKIADMKYNVLLLAMIIFLSLVMVASDTVDANALAPIITFIMGLVIPFNEKKEGN